MQKFRVNCVDIWEEACLGSQATIALNKDKSIKIICPHYPCTANRLCCLLCHKQEDFGCIIYMKNDGERLRDLMEWQVFKDKIRQGKL